MKNRWILVTRITNFVLFTALSLVGAAAAQTLDKGKKPERYWTTKACETSVEIDGYDFDFEIARRGSGLVDGPFSHNGRYRVLRNVPGTLDLRLNIGTDARQRNDLDVELRIHRGRARVSGSVHGRRIRTLTAPVIRKNGYFELRFRVGKRNGQATDHTIRWPAR